MLRRAESVRRSDARRIQGVCCTDYNSEGWQSLCAELFAVATIPGDKVPRRLDTQLQATKFNEILHSCVLSYQEMGSINTYH
jgi:hypothetical protein